MPTLTDVEKELANYSYKPGTDFRCHFSYPGPPNAVVDPAGILALKVLPEALVITMVYIAFNSNGDLGQVYRMIGLPWPLPDEWEDYLNLQLETLINDAEAYQTDKWFQYKGLSVHEPNP